MMTRPTPWWVACALALAMPAAAQDTLHFDHALAGSPATTFEARPSYPAEAIAAKVEGIVLLDVLVGTDGRVRTARVLASVPMLDAEALRCVRLWTFAPPQLAGRPVPAWVMVRIVFKLQGELPGGLVSVPARPSTPAAFEPRPEDWAIEPCSEVLRHTPEEWLGHDRGVIEIDYRSAAWAACKRAETLARFRDHAGVMALLGGIDRRLVAMHDELRGLRVLQAGTDGLMGHIGGRYEMQVEIGFARIAQLWLDRTAYDRSEAIDAECRALHDRILARVGAPRPREALAWEWGNDTALVARKWNGYARPYLEHLDAVTYFYNVASYTHGWAWTRATLEILRLLDAMNAYVLLGDDEAEKLNCGRRFLPNRPPPPPPPPPPGAPHR